MKKASILISMVLCALATVAVISPFCVQPVAAGRFKYKITLWQNGCDARSVGYMTHNGIQVPEGVGWDLSCKSESKSTGWFQTEWEVNDWHFTIWIYDSCHLGDPAYLKPGYPKTVDEKDFTVPHEWKSGPLSPAEVVMTITSPSVGGIVLPVDKLGLLAPYIGLTSTIMATVVAAAIYVKRVNHRKEKQ
jgi:hypothetical protein